MGGFGPLLTGRAARLRADTPTATGMSPLMKLLSQFLTAAGQDVLQGAGGKHTGAAVNQNLASQGYQKILSALLSGDGSMGGKMTLDEKGMKLELPPPTDVGAGSPSGLSQGARAGVNTQTSVPGATATPTPATSGVGITQEMISALNPSISLAGIGAADLAGVDPSLITQALQFKFAQEQLGTQRMRDMVDAVYKGGMLEVAGQQLEDADLDRDVRNFQAVTNRINALESLLPEGIDQPYPVKVPGVGIVTNRQWASLPDDDREYALYHHGMLEAGRDPVEKGEFDKLKPTEKIKTLEQLNLDPELLKIEKDLRRSGRSTTTIDLSGRLEREDAMSKLTARQFFRGDWVGEIDDITAYSSDEAFSLSQRYQKELDMDAVEARAQATLDTRISSIEKRVRAGGGKIVKRSRTRDGVYTFVVEWPEIRDSDGNVLLPEQEETIRYGTQ